MMDRRRAGWLIPTVCCVMALGHCVPALAQAEPGKSCQGVDDSNNRSVSLGELAPNVICDQRQIWTFPARLNRRRNWIIAGAVVAGTAGLVALDHSDAPYFRNNNWTTFNSGFSGTKTAAATIVAPAALYGFGLVRHDQYEQNTALLAGEAAADAEIVSFIFKDATHRLRPNGVPVNGNFNDTWYDKSGWSGATSFPSGHEITAFSVATVIARRYGRRRHWVPYVAYGGAALIGFSRVTTSAHFPSDVFLGAALGYGIGRVAALQ